MAHQFTGNCSNYNFTAKKSAKTEDKYKAAGKSTQFVTLQIIPLVN